MRITIVISNYNYRQFVGQAIESALGQTHDDVEVIVVDDGSTDDSMAVIGRFRNRIKLIEQTNGGQGAAYNAGYAQATGAVVMFLDADDWLHPQAAACVAAAWRPGLSKVQFPLELVDREGRSLGRRVPRGMHDREAMALLKVFGAYGSPPASGNAFDIGFLAHVMPMDEANWRTAADSVPILLAPAYGDIVSLPTVLGAYRQHRPREDGSLLSNNAPASVRHEFERIAWTKRVVERSLFALGQVPTVPQWLAPWEARLAVLCARFGGETAAAATPQAASVAQIMRFALRSVWKWPMSGHLQKSALSLWMVGVWLLPLPLARRLAGLHRALVGVRTRS